MGLRELSRAQRQSAILDHVSAATRRGELASFNGGYAANCRIRNFSDYFVHDDIYLEKNPVRSGCISAQT